MRRHGVLGLVLVAVAIPASGGSSAGMESRLAGMGSVRGDHLDGERVLTSVSDPKDVEACSFAPDCPIDIRAVSKRHFRTASGKKMIAFSVNAYELYGGLVFVANFRLPLDTRAGPRSDTQIFMSLTELFIDIRWACGREFEAGSVSRRYHVKERGDRLTCFIPRRALHPTKRIRFKALSRVNKEVIDRAPDHVWGEG